MWQTLRAVLFHSKPQTSKLDMVLDFIFCRRSKNSWYPSTWFISVFVNRFPCKFKSISDVSVKSDFGNGCRTSFLSLDVAFFRCSWLLRRDKTLSFDNLPIASGSVTIMLESRRNSSKLCKLRIESGTVDSWFDDRSNFSNLFNDVDTTDLGILERKLPDRFSCFNVVGRNGRASKAAVVPSGALTLLWCFTGIGFPSLFPESDKVCSFVNGARHSSEPANRLLLSRFKIFNSVSDPNRLTSERLFLERSNVRSFFANSESKIWTGNSFKACSLSERTPSFFAFSNFYRHAE